MSLNINEIEALLPGYLSGELSDQERAIIDSWRAASHENEAHFLNSLKAWESIPLLHEMEKFNSFEALNKIHGKVNHSVKGRWSNILRLAAAIFFLPLLGYTGYLAFQNFSLKKRMMENVVMQTISSRQGMVSQFQLADGTKVWLNSGSEIEFPSVFAGEFREVKLNGEAFFEVSKNRNQPFRVNAKELQVEVTGTSFDVACYSEEKFSEVILVEGSVNLAAQEADKILENRTLHPGQRGVYNEVTGKIRTEEVSVDKYISWREGNLIFRDDKMEEVVKRLSRWFNVEIFINDPEIKSYIYKATFRNENLVQVLNLLKISAPIDFSITERKALQNGEFTKQKVYLMKKKA